MASRDCAPFTVFLCKRKFGSNHSVDGAPAPCKRRQSTEEHATPKAEIEPSVRGGLGRSKSTMVCFEKGGGQSGDPCWAALYSRSRASPVISGPSLADHCRTTWSGNSRERARRERKLETLPRVAEHFRDCVERAHRILSQQLTAVFGWFSGISWLPHHTPWWSVHYVPSGHHLNHDLFTTHVTGSRHLPERSNRFSGGSQGSTSRCL